MRDCLHSRMMSSYSSRLRVKKDYKMVRNSYAVVYLDLGERKKKVCSQPGFVSVRHACYRDEFERGVGQKLFSFSPRSRFRISDILTMYLFVLRRVRKIFSVSHYYRRHVCLSVGTEQLGFHSTACCEISRRFFLTKICR